MKVSDGTFGEQTTVVNAHFGNMEVMRSASKNATREQKHRSISCGHDSSVEHDDNPARLSSTFNIQAHDAKFRNSAMTRQSIRDSLKSK